MTSERLREIIAEAAAINVSDVHLEHPSDMTHGDLSCNAALVLAKERAVNPRDLAEGIVRYIEAHKPEEVERVEIAGSGFINFHLSRPFFTESVADIRRAGEQWGKNQRLSGKKVMVEYTDPNPFKEFHIGHLMNNAIGESISRVVEYAGAEVRRANYQGDVGLHVAQALWGKQRKPELSWGEAYAFGSKNYESHKEDIDGINKKLYEHSDEKLNALYDEGRRTSLEAFEILYKRLDTKFDHYFFESETASLGQKLVKEHSDVFEESDGATVFRGERHDPSLHTRVFITSQGIPTYEAKELGLAKLKFKAWPHDHSIVVTASEIAAYYRVVMKALQEIEPGIARKIHHVPHGFLRLPTGKMSSRTGDVITAASLIEDVKRAALEKMRESDMLQKEDIAEQVAVAAIKYSILKQATGRDIIFDMRKALSFEGDSGPYLQYAHARARSVLNKAEREGVVPDTARAPETVTELERLLYRFPEVVERALDDYAPHYITTFLTDIAGAFNSWYARETIVDDTPDAPYKVALTEAFAITMRNGLWLLGIRAPEQM